MKRYRDGGESQALDRNGDVSEEYIVIIWHHEGGLYEINSTKINNLTPEQLEEIKYFDGGSPEKDNTRFLDMEGDIFYEDCADGTFKKRDMWSKIDTTVKDAVPEGGTVKLENIINISSWC